MSHNLKSVVDIWNKRSGQYSEIGFEDNGGKKTDMLTGSSNGLIEEDVADMAC